MIKKAIIFIILACNITACSSLQPMNTSSSRSFTSDKVADSSSTGSRILAFPFYAVGGIAMGLGTLGVGAFDSENSESEKQSEAENVLLGLSLIAGGYLLWQIGESIAGE